MSGTRAEAVPSATPARASAWWARLPWALLPILVAQASASASLLRANTAFQDEALYLWAGRLELSHWLRGTPIPAFPTYFSGAPAIYPPLGALADRLGGLAGARALSLVFMLLTTSLLWATVSRLQGRRAAFFACALFALLGASLRLGAFATYDAMAICLMALASWASVRAAQLSSSSAWLALAALALVLANATKYATLLFDPVVIGLLVVVSLPAVGRRQALARGGTMLAYSLGLGALLLVLGGGEYLTGILQTTLAREPGTTSAAAVISQSVELTALVAAPAALGLLLALASRRRRSELPLVALLALAVLLVPLAYVHLQSLTSLSKHLDFGAWFGAGAAGYGLDRLLALLRWPRPQRVAAALLVLALAGSGLLGLAQAHQLFRGWPDSGPLVRGAERTLGDTRGPILAENPSLLEYYLPAGTQWWRWSSSCSIRLPEGGSISRPVGLCLSPKAYTTRIRHGFFSSVVLLFGAGGPFDGRVLRALRGNRHYRLVATAPYGGTSAQLWRYRPQDHFPASGRAPSGPAVPALQELFTPAARPSPVLGPVADGVAVSGLLTLVLLLGIRFGWRRRKAVTDP